MGRDKFFFFSVPVVSSRHLWIFSFLLISLFWKERENGSDILLILILGVTWTFCFSLLGTYLFILSSLALFTYCWVRFFFYYFYLPFSCFLLFPFCGISFGEGIAILEGTTLPFFPLLGAQITEYSS
jgi:hypothetical protein